MKIWGRGKDDDMEECNDPDCKSCGGSGWIEVCKQCDQPLAKHSYKQQLLCMEELGR